MPTTGIHKQETVAEDHDQMGVAEAANRRAAEGVRTIMYAANLPKELWGELFQSWADVDWFIVNRAEGYSPYFLRYGRPPLREVGELRAIGSRVTYYGRREDATKLDMKGHRAVYLGRDRQNGGYRVLDVEAIDPVVRTVTDLSPQSFDELTDFEPTGVTDSDIKLTSEDMPLRTVWHYPPIRAVRDTIRLPDEPGKGSMWRCYQLYREQRMLELLNANNCLAPNDAKHQVDAEWREEVRKDVYRDPATRLARLAELAEASEAATNTTRTKAGAPCSNTPGTKAGAPSSNTPGTKAGARDAKNKSGGDNTSADSESQDDLRCQVCSKTDDPENMLLCDACEQAFHIHCLGGTSLPSTKVNQLWFCRKCRKVGMRIQVELPDAGRTRSGSRWCDAVILAAKPDGSCKLRDDVTQVVHDDIYLDTLKWYARETPATTSAMHAAIIASVTKVELTEAQMYDKPPRNATEALNESNALREYWAGAMLTHYKKLFKKGVFVVVDRQDLPADALILHHMWIYVVKVDKFSARLVVLGNHAPPTDTQTSSPTPRAPVWKFLFSLAVKMGYPIRHIDLSSGFCHTVPQRQIFMRMPQGLGDPNKFLLVRRNLFGMPEAPADLYMANWNFMRSYGLEQTIFDPCVYVPNKANAEKWPMLFVILWVDDFAICAPTWWADEFVAAYSKVFDVEDLGLLKRWMGMEATWTAEGLYITHMRQVQMIVHRARLTDNRNVQIPMSGERLTKELCCKTDADREFMSDKPYRSLVAAIGYIANLGVRLDVAFAQSELSRYNDCAGPGHWEALINLLHYLRKHPNLGVLFPRTGGFELRATCDSDFNGCKDERTSKTGVTLDIGGALFNYICRAQKWTAKSVGAAEYHAMATCAAELLFYRQVLHAVGFKAGTCPVFKTDKPEADQWIPTLFSDSTVALGNAAKPVNWLTEKLKHTEIHVNFFRQYVAEGYFKLAKIASELNPSDALTKLFPTRESFRKAIGHFMVELPFKYRPATGDAHSDTIASPVDHTATSKSGEARPDSAKPSSGGVRPPKSGDAQRQEPNDALPLPDSET